jgi:hypothetical protein
MDVNNELTVGLVRLLFGVGFYIIPFKVIKKHEIIIIE